MIYLLTAILAVKIIILAVIPIKMVMLTAKMAVIC